jgi:beta-lactamase superfamily II metal-dependent hydrolase
MPVDTGHYRNDGEYVLQYLQAHGIDRIDHLVVSHNDADTLPAEARHADAILTVTIIHTEITRLNYQPDRTKDRNQAAQDRFDRLSSRPLPDDDTSHFTLL